MVWNVYYFEEEDGSCPAKEVLGAKKGVPKGLVDLLEAVILRYIIPLGTGAPYSIFHRVEEFWQIRFKDYRALCYLPTDEPQTIIVLNVFKKDSNDTPPNGTLEIARTLMKKDAIRKEKEKK